MTHPRAVRASLASIALAVGAGLAGCSGEDAAEPSFAVSTAADGSTYNSADVAFATDMVQHHAQAVAMAVVADGRPLDPEVETLKNVIREAQVPEIETMSDWLVAWGEPVPETMMGHGAADHGAPLSEGMEGMDADMPGMMTADEMAGLENASDADFQDLWLELMLEHHRGAVSMAENEVTEGEDADAVALAEDVVTSQGAEIETMEALLG
ncbi:MAG: DUF305 domain-containing protein [Nocardioides sp.]|nr:DUF305 domain-containing protein [Nocardioides sp.]